MERRFFLTRHSRKPKGEDVESKIYKGISKSGVELAIQSTQNILMDIEKSPKGAIIFLGGASDEPRTRSTAEIYGAELKKMLSDRKDDYIVITKKDISRRKSYSTIIKEIKGIIDANPEKKIIVDIPLFLKELSPKRKGWWNKEGKPSPYLAKLMEKHKGSEYDAMKDWIDSQGAGGGPKPIEAAKSYEKGLNRLEKFARKYVGDRPYVTGIVGHSWDADAYLTYIAGDGKIDLSTFEKISSGKGMIKETELASVKSDKYLTSLSYRGKEHQTKKKNLERFLTILMTISGLGAFVSFFSKPFLINQQIPTQQLAPPLPNYLPYFFLLILILGVIYFLIQKFRKRTIYL